MKVEVVTPDKKIFEGNADGVQLCGIEGSFEVLNNHAPMISALGSGNVRITQGKDQKFIRIDGGVVEVLNNNVIVLAESAAV